MRLRISHKLMLAGLTALAVALAGCAGPQEAQDDTTPGDGAAAPQPQAVTIDDRVFECDETLDTDGICDEYVASDDPNAQADVTATSNADGSVTIDGREYLCDDTIDVGVAQDNDTGVDVTQQGACEEYGLAGER